MKNEDLKTAQGRFHFINTRNYLTTHDIAIFLDVCDNTANVKKKKAVELSGHPATKRKMAVPTKYVLAALDITMDELEKAAIREIRVRSTK